MGGATACDSGSPSDATKAAFTSAATGSLNPAIALCNVIYLLGLTRLLAGVFRDALLDIGHRPGKRFAQLLRYAILISSLFNG
ncbi:hypothetical protein Bra1253DRAFT_00064 [Bradyrhizobium sp. WSM1253]|nr:hypothetical protein Bra1253DRAFT_00064 [Bradyrhizobium sp. WSM1253]